MNSLTDTTEKEETAAQKQTKTKKNKKNRRSQREIKRNIQRSYLISKNRVIFILTETEEMMEKENLNYLSEDATVNRGDYFIVLKYQEKLLLNHHDGKGLDSTCIKLTD